MKKKTVSPNGFLHGDLSQTVLGLERGLLHLSTLKTVSLHQDHSLKGYHLEWMSRHQMTGKTQPETRY